MMNTETEEIQNSKFSEESLSFIQKTSLFNKKISIQISILGLWIVSVLLIIIFISYQQLFMAYVYQDILPYNLDWMIYLAIIITSLGGSLLFLMPVSPNFYDKMKIIQDYPEIVKNVIELMLKQEFLQSMGKIEDYLKNLNKYNINKNRANILDLMRKCEINRNVYEKVNEINNLIENNNKLQAFEKFSQISHLITNNYVYLLKNQINAFDQLVSKFNL